MWYKFALVACLSFFLFHRTDAQMSVQNIAHLIIPVSYKGQLIDAYELEDRAGRHIFLATHIRSNKADSLFVRYFTLVNGTFVQDWQIKDFSRYGLVTLFTVTKFADIDGDGVFETLFAYRLEGDMLNKGILTIKAMLFYTNKKYAIRGQAHYGSNDPGTAVMDSEFDTIPLAIKKYAIRFWNSLSDFEILKNIPLSAN